MYIYVVRNRRRGGRGPTAGAVCCCCRCSASYCWIYTVCTSSGCVRGGVSVDVTKGWCGRPDGLSFFLQLPRWWWTRQRERSPPWSCMCVSVFSSHFLSWALRVYNLEDYQSRNTSGGVMLYSSSNGKQQNQPSVQKKRAAYNRGPSRQRVQTKTCRGGLKPL